MGRTVLAVTAESEAATGLRAPGANLLLVDLAPDPGHGASPGPPVRHFT